MAIRTEIFKVSDYDRIHAPKCGKTPARKADDDLLHGEWDMDPITYKYDTGYCRACAIAKITVTVEGVDYANHYGGRVESRLNRWTSGDRLQVFAIHHEGLVIASRERNYHDDSDFYALVWNPERKTIEEHSVGTTRFGGTDDNSASVDLADEYKADYHAFLVERQMTASKAADIQAWREAAYAAVTPGAKGQQVVVFKGRKVPVGFTGTVIWVGEGFGGRGTRIGIRAADGDTQFTDAANCKVIIDPDDLPYEADFVKSEDEYRRIAEGIVGFEYRGLVAFIAANAPAGIHAVA